MFPSTRKNIAILAEEKSKRDAVAPRPIVFVKIIGQL